MGVLSDNTSRESVVVYLSLGSNMGDRLLNLREALRRLSGYEEIRLIAWASIYETEPVGLTDQPVFYNTAVKLDTTLLPRDLLAVCHRIEEQLERDRTIHWGPRTLDIDILTYDNLQINENGLVIPHPEMNQRDFVLIPLKEIDEGVIGCTREVRPMYENWYSHGMET